jgi:hypothetical protein
MVVITNETAAGARRRLVVSPAACAATPRPPAGPVVERVTHVAFQRRLCAALDAKRTVVRCALVRIDAVTRVQPGDTWSLARAPISARATPQPHVATYKRATPRDIAQCNVIVASDGRTWRGSLDSGCAPSHLSSQPNSRA